MNQAYKKLTESLTTPSDLSFDSDRAVTDFRAFEPMAILHSERVDNPLALDVMEEVIDSVKNALQSRKKKIELV